MLLVPQRLESSHRRMQAEEAVQINHALLSIARTRNRNAGTHAVIRLLAVRYNNVQAVSGAALKEDDQALLPRSSGLSRIDGACKEAGNNVCADDGQRAVL